MNADHIQAEIKKICMHPEVEHCFAYQFCEMENYCVICSFNPNAKIEDWFKDVRKMKATK